MGDPASLDCCLQLHHGAVKVFGTPSPLLPPLSRMVTSGQAVRDPGISRLLGEEEIGNWSLTADTIDWLTELLEHELPHAVLEFGSGVSSACLCVVLTRIHGSTGFRLLSLEQDRAQRQRTLRRLTNLPGSQCCRVVHVPLVLSLISGQDTSAYDLEALDSNHLAWLGKIDFVLIDGPYAEGPCRYATLPPVRSRLVNGARFAMDDALRAQELEVAELWAGQGFAIDGILTIGRGVLVGSVFDEAESKNSRKEHRTTREDG